MRPCKFWVDEDKRPETVGLCVECGESLKGFDQVIDLYPSIRPVSWKYVDKIRPVPLPSNKNIHVFLLRGRTAMVEIGGTKFAVQTRSSSPPLEWKDEHSEKSNYSDNIFDMWIRMKKMVGDFSISPEKVQAKWRNQL